MAGLRSICIGQSGCGKTTLTQKMLDQRPKKMPCLIYDINQEYGKYYPEKFVDFDVFLEMLMDEEVRHRYIIIEEATIFFNTHSHSMEMTNILVRARHTGNIIQLNFHSFASMPKGIYNLMNYVIVFKTQDNEKSVTDRFDHPKVLEAYREAKASPDIHFYKVIKIN